ncbi:YL1 nuclear protein-domain-containing protein [Roridomyces roridus]|uniref:YL1 nuclear protein-domain-containing protein n=1 Tax=Roridomyces roridus TaxID=1738132 RepID=A0AAD7G2N0_9AGAR|nr:YL1 nuclear protein-domain-containing protein [Roridomyces roridus]
MDMDVDDFLVTRRSRRSTAGNRMEAAMAEMGAEELKDAEDDADFTNDKDEEDVFDADFESTDDEAQADDAAAETTVQDEEKRVRKANRSRLEKATDAAHVRNRATFAPQTAAPKVKRRVATVEAIPGPSRPATHRQSTRIHTILNTSQTETRLKRSEERRAAQTIKKPREVRTVSQAELIARALDAEEGNIVQHRDYLKIEEEKRRRARVVRPTVEGPLLRWVSRKEEVTMVVPPPPPPTYGYAYGSGGGYVYPTYQPTNSQPSYVFPPPNSSSAPVYPAYTPVVHLEKVARNYVVHEQGQDPEILASAGRNNARAPLSDAKPTWGETMTAMFGSHVNWEDVTAYTAKGRPMGRPVQVCPLTGRIARYRDPRTGVPFADVGAFEVLTRVLNHEYVWSREIGAYIHAQGTT